MVDAQAGHEKTLTLILPALAGCNLIYGIGMLESGLTLDYAQLVIDDEIVAMCKRVLRGIRVSDETLAVDLIKGVGPGRDYLGQRHTREMQHGELTKARLFDRRMRGAWEKRGGRSVAEVALEVAVRLLETHEPVALAPEVSQALEKIVTDVEKELASPGSVPDGRRTSG